MHLLAHVYADRNADLWKDHAALLRSAVSSGVPPLSPSRAKFSYPEAQQEAVYRHVVQFEAKRTWQAFLPARVRARVGYMWDPLPPSSEGSTSYTSGDFFEGVHFDRGGPDEIDEAFLMQQLRGMWAQIPMLADMFPDPARFANLLRDAPEEAMGILMQAREQVREAAPAPAEVQREVEVQFAPEGQGVPGGFATDESGEEEESEEEDEEEDEEGGRDNRGFAQRIFQGLFGWSGGRAAVPQADEDEDDDEEDDSGDEARLLQRGHDDDVD